MIPTGTAILRFAFVRRYVCAREMIKKSGEVYDFARPPGTEMVNGGFFPHRYFYNSSVDLIIFSSISGRIYYK